MLRIGRIYLTKKRIVWGSLTVSSLLIGLVLTFVYRGLAGSLSDQQMATRWSDERDTAQISCFFPYDTGINPDRIEMFQYELDKAMVEASITSDSPNANARLWASAYASVGRLNISNDKTSFSVKALGVGEDYFLFHPLDLIGGNHFSGQDVMQDYCILDKEAAWKLFGSSDVVGQYVTIANVPHQIVGVYEQKTDKLHKKAGLDEAFIYVSYETLSKYGSVKEIQCYEIVMPNPVENYALKYVNEHLGDTEGRIEVLENTSRFSVGNIIRLLSDFGTRSMKTNALAYPYWENVAKGYEDYLTLLLLFILIFFLFPFSVILICVIIAWKRKTWNTKTVIEKIKVHSEGLSDWYRETREKRKIERREDEDEF